MGDPGVGKKSLSLYFSQLLLKETFSINCTLITREEEHSQIKIEQLRELRESQGFGGYGSNFKVILIPEAHEMTLQAANALLKILEEPPKGWIFILTSSYPHLLPITILSRCQKHQVQPLNEVSLQKILEELLPESKPELPKTLFFAQGSLGKALRYLDKRSEPMKLLSERFVRSPSLEINTVIDKLSQSEQDLEFFIDLTEVELHQRLKHQQKLHSQTLPKTLASFDSLARLREGTGLPLNKKLLLQEYLFSWV
jgi:hypothetical protein